MDAIKIVNKIKEKAQEEARQIGSDEYAYALGVFGSLLELAIASVEGGYAQYFLNRMKQFEEE